MADSMSHESARVERYLEAMEAALWAVSDEQRAEIILETRSHIAERVAGQGVPADQVLDELGPPETYALAFIDQSLVEELPPPATRAPRQRMRELIALALVGVAYAINALLFLTIVSKLVEPRATGFVVDRRPAHRFIGLVLSDASLNENDVLGLWIIPIAAALVTVLHVGAWRLLRSLRERSTSAASIVV